jgi:hypothetical protein
MRAPSSRWYWVLAAWPAFAALVLSGYNQFWPHREISKTEDAVGIWIFRLMLVASVALLIVYPRALERSRAEGNPGASSLRLAFMFLCLSTVFQFFLVTIAFQPSY